SNEAIADGLSRLSSKKRPVPVIVIGVGDYKQPANIRIDDLQIPEIVRPDDRFPIIVTVIGQGLEGEELPVVLEAQRVKDAQGQPIADEPVIKLPARTGKFQGAGDHPRDQIEYEIDLPELKGVKLTEDNSGEIEGVWQFRAIVPRHAREVTTQEH